MLVLRLFAVAIPTLLIAALLISPIVVIIMHQQGRFRPKAVTIQNPASGNLTRIELDEIREVALDEGIESQLYFKDGAHMAIKTKDAERLVKYFSPLS